MVRDRVSVLIVQWGKTELTERAVDSVRRSHYQGEIEVLVYDNASPDGPGPVADRTDVTLVQGTENIGFGPAHNLLSAEATGTYLFILNNDTIVEPRALERMVVRSEAADRPGAVVPQYRNFDGEVLEMGGYLGDSGAGWQLFHGMRPPEAMKRLSYPAHYGSAAAMLIRREDFRRLEGFDDLFAPAYYEDTDLCLRLEAEGRPTIVEPSAVVFHYEGATAGRETSTGMKQYQVRNRTLFLDRWRSRLEGLGAASLPNSLAHALAPAPGGRRVLWVAPHLPRPDREAGHHRMMRMIEALVEVGDRVVLWAEQCLNEETSGRYLEGAGVPWFGTLRDHEWGLQPQETAFASVDRIAQAVPWDVIIVSFPELASRMLSRLREACPGAAILVDDVDLHFLRAERGREAGIKVQNVISRTDELAVYSASDGVITASDHETMVLGEILPGVPAWSYTVAAEQPRDVDKADQRSLMFLGNFNHPPNVDAVEWWIAELGPLVESSLERPLALRVVGTGSDILRPVWERTAGPLIDCVGWVPDLNPELAKTRVFLAPLRYGAGTKGKILNALTHGIPVVTTSVGAEGNSPEVQRSLVVADDPAELASHVVRLMSDDIQWEEARSLAIEAGIAVWKQQRAVSQEFAAWVHRRVAAGPALI